MATKSQTDTREEPPPFDMDPSLLDLSGPKSAGALVPMRAPEPTMSITGEVITAQKVHIKRDMAEVMAHIKILAAAAGQRWFYRIPFKNRKKGTTEYVEGLTIKGANAVFRAYGNVLLRLGVQDLRTHWAIEAVVVDLERGTNYGRPYLQRKGQDTGMSDFDRAGDMIFQIGVSKATRNVIVNALEDLCAFAFDEARSGLQNRVGNNPAGAKKWILDKLAELGVDVKRVSAVYGRSPDNWLVPDMAKMYAELNAIEEGMADVGEVYPVVGAGTKDPDPPKKPNFDAPKAPPIPEPEREPDKPAVASNGASFAQMSDMLKAANTRETFDFIRSSWKHLPMDQQAELTGLAATLYSERFMKKDEGEDAPKKKAPPLFG